jgi:colanic acid biosynthesis glycosyl transferase WcaI
VRRLAAWEGRLLRTADAVGVVTEALMRRHSVQHGVASDRLFVVPNGAWVPPPLGDDVLALRHENGVAPRDFLVGFAGNFNAAQGLDLLLELLSRSDLPQLRCWVIGEAPERREWEEQARRRGARVSFPGSLPEAEADRRLQACQLLLAPYRADDFSRIVGGMSSLKVLTALACDRPLLASDAPGLETLRGIDSVTLADASDPQAWAAAIRQHVEAWESAGRPLRDWPWPEGRGPGRRCIEAGLTWDHTAAAWETVFARATAGPRR